MSTLTGAVAEREAPVRGRAVPPPPLRRFPRGDGEPWPAPRPAPVGLPPAFVAMLIFIAAEAMLFFGLITAFLVYRLGSPLWPPLGEPKLPIGVTAVNTAILFLSAGTMRRARGRAGAGDTAAGVRWLGLTALLGTVFLAIQGSEWLRLLHWGLTAATSPYGGIFYLLIGTHGVHVLAAVVALSVLAAAGRAGRISPARLEAASLYWYFVCAVWAVLFPLVYF